MNGQLNQPDNNKQTMKKSLKLRAFVAPTPYIIAAAYDGNGKADACGLAFVMPSSHIPPCVTIGINATAKRKTLKSILERGAFTVGYPGADGIANADYLGIFSSYEHDKLADVGWTATKSEHVDAPVIDQIPLTLECKVVDTVTVGSHTHITGEVVNILADEGIVDERGKVDLEKMRPVIYDEERRIYRGVGGELARAFNAGLVFRK